MLTDPHINLLSDAMLAAFYRQIGEGAVKQVWIDDDGRVRVQLDDQRVGVAEVVVQWDLGAPKLPKTFEQEKL
jgi:hypothetical protein